MPEEKKKYRFCLIPAFRLSGTRFIDMGMGLSKEQRLMNYNNVKHLLEDVEWDMHEGPLAPFGDWPVENREEVLPSSRSPFTHCP